MANHVYAEATLPMYNRELPAVNRGYQQPEINPDNNHLYAHPSHIELNNEPYEYHYPVTANPTINREDNSAPRSPSPAHYVDPTGATQVPRSPSPPYYVDPIADTEVIQPNQYHTLEPPSKK